MNSGATSERVYDALKAQILNRAYLPGARLDPVRLAEGLLSSATPVRDALHRLNGETLVVTRPSDGFHLPAIDAPGLQDMYDWNRDIVSLALRAGPKDRPAFIKSAPGAPVDRIASCFTAIASNSINGEHARAVAGLNDRLHAARLAEGEILADVEAETDLIAQAIADDRRDDVRRLITAYHGRRRRASAEIVRALHRAPPTFEK